MVLITYKRLRHFLTWFGAWRIHGLTVYLIVLVKSHHVILLLDLKFFEVVRRIVLVHRRSWNPFITLSQRGKLEIIFIYRTDVTESVIIITFEVWILIRRNVAILTISNSLNVRVMIPCRINKLLSASSLTIQVWARLAAIFVVWGLWDDILIVELVIEIWDHGRSIISSNVVLLILCVSTVILLGIAAVRCVWGVISLTMLKKIVSTCYRYNKEFTIRLRMWS